MPVEIKRIRPAAASGMSRSATPQCCAPFDLAGAYGGATRRSNRAEIVERNGWDAELCAKPSTYKLNGRYYCSLHAGQAALRFLETAFGYDDRAIALAEQEGEAPQ